MGLDLDYIDGQTPLDEDEKEGLLIPTIATRGELDEFEQKISNRLCYGRLTVPLKPMRCLQKILQEGCISVCTTMFGLGQVSFAKPIRISEWINGKYQLN